MWKANNYESQSICLPSDSDTDVEEEEEESGGDIRYLVGDVTQPQRTGQDDAIVVHCVGMLHFLFCVYFIHFIYF